MPSLDNLFDSHKPALLEFRPTLCQAQSVGSCRLSNP